MSILENSHRLKERILGLLDEANQQEEGLKSDWRGLQSVSAVLLVLGMQGDETGSSQEPCLILNKRSSKVRQAGDLCCPGGRVSPRLDHYLAKFLTLPVFPLARWPHWSVWRNQRPEEACRLALLLATSLRESYEEMRLNPLKVQFLGALPTQELLMQQRVIYPMVGWISNQDTFKPNWEVEKVVSISLKDLLDHSYYARYRISFTPGSDQSFRLPTNDFPCFIHKNQDEEEVLWGATYRIVTTFLRLICNFTPPDLATLPVVPGILDENYYNGSPKKQTAF